MTCRIAAPDRRLGLVGWLGLSSALLFPVSTAHAHSFAVAYVEVEQTDVTHALVTLKTPRVGDNVPTLTLITPGCEHSERRPPQTVDGAVVDQFRISCRASMADLELGVHGLGGEVSEAIVMLHLFGHEPRFTIVETATPRGLAATDGLLTSPGSSAGSSAPTREYLALGAEHMLTGTDHLLFVLGLILVLAQRRRVHGTALVGPLVGTITAFTLAHSLTLGLTALGLVQVPARPVELLIALSILLLAVELVGHGALADTLTFRRPQLVAFGFGLLHGFGFAGALRSLGLPEGDALPALLFFNLGVELAQLAFVALLLALALLGSSVLARVARRGAGLHPFFEPASLSVALGHGLGAVAAYWCIARGVELLSHGPLS